jgi:hypothetical protein
MKKVMSVLLGVLVCAGAAVAGPFPSTVTNDVYGIAQGGSANGIPTANNNNDGVPDIHDAINQLLGTSYTQNYQVDALYVDSDSIWQDVGAVSLIGMTAGNSNTLGVYTDLGVGAAKTAVIGPYSNNFGFLGDGTAAHPYPAGTTGLGGGTSFGWYLNSSGANYYSEAALNELDLDHMMTFELAGLKGQTIWVDYGNGPMQITLNNPYLICWEDLPWSNGALGDEDYDDMMYVVDMIPTPLPGAILLGMLGLGCAGYRLRRQTA